MKRYAFLVAAVLAATVVFSSCSLLPVKKETRVNYDFFDTVSVYTDESGEGGAAAEAKFDKADALFSEYHKLFDIYHEYEGMNNVATLNRMAGKGAVSLDEKLIDLLLFAKEMYLFTDGECNVGMGAVLSLWHAAREAANEDPEHAALPDEAALEEAAKHTDLDLLLIDKEAKTAQILDEKMSLDLGALGKGYAVERVAEALEADGVSAFVLDVGSNLRVLGTKADGKPWSAGVRNPKQGASPDYVYVTDISETAFVTSGDYERFFTVGGVRYAHIIDKDTAKPPRYYVSVSVLTKDSGMADALSTAMFCMTEEEIDRLLSRADFPIDVILVFADGGVLHKSGTSTGN